MHMRERIFKVTDALKNAERKNLKNDGKRVTKRKNVVYLERSHARASSVGRIHLIIRNRTEKGEKRKSPQWDSGPGSPPEVARSEVKDSRGCPKKDFDRGMGERREVKGSKGLLWGFEARSRQKAESVPCYSVHFENTCAEEGEMRGSSSLE